MVICKKCGTNRWRIQTAERDGGEIICLECIKCIECGHTQKIYAYCNNGRIIILKKKNEEEIGNYNFSPLNCPKSNCKGNEWEILQGKMVCKRCRQKSELHTGVRTSIQSRPRKKVGDYYP